MEIRDLMDRYTTAAVRVGEAGERLRAEVSNGAESDGFSRVAAEFLAAGDKWRAEGAKVAESLRNAQYPNHR